MHTPLPDLDYMTGAPSVSASVFREDVDVSAHVMAEATADIWEMTPLQDKNGFGRAVGSIWMVDDLCLSEYLMPPALICMDARHTRDVGSHIMLERWLSGEERGVLGDGDYTGSAPGIIDFFHQELKTKTVCSWRRVQDLSVPREMLGLPSGEAVNPPEIVEASAIGQLVFAEWDDLFADLKSGKGKLSHVKIDRALACVKIAIGAHPQREDVRKQARDAVFRQICRFIERNLEDPNLSTHLLLDRFGVSRATLYRMFEPLGGVRNYVTERRAASALFFISNSESRRGFVQSACERFGFSSPANFNRTIQRLFGNSPKALLFGRNETGQDTSSLSNFIHDYLEVAYNGVSGGLPDLAA